MHVYLKRITVRREGVFLMIKLWIPWHTRHVYTQIFQQTDSTLRKLLINLNDCLRSELENWLKIAYLYISELNTVWKERGILIPSYEFHETPVMFTHRGVRQMGSILRKLPINFNDYLRLNWKLNWLKMHVYYFEKTYIKPDRRWKRKMHLNIKLWISWNTSHVYAQRCSTNEKRPRSR